MINNIFIFEDDKHANFLPLTYLRPVYDLICGISPLIAKIARLFPEANISLHCRKHLKNIVKQNHAGIGVNNLNTGLGCLIINGRLLAGEKIRDSLLLDGRDRLFINEDDEVVAGYLNTDNLYILRNILDDSLSSRRIINTFRNKTEITNISARLLKYPWDILNANAEQITLDFKAAVPLGIVKGDIHSSVAILDEYKLYVGEDTRILPGVTINCEKGPVYIGENCLIKANTYIEGPVYIGKYSVISNSQILSGSSIGPNCMIHQSELENTTLQGCSNLDHNCLRTAYLADCVNIAAGSFNKDTFDPFSKEPVFYLQGEEIDFDLTKFGMLCGDFASIGTQIQLPAGSSYGVASSLTASHLTAPRYVPCFVQQSEDDSFDEISLREILERLEHLLDNKKVELTKVERDLIETLHGSLGSERRSSKVIY